MSAWKRIKVWLLRLTFALLAILLVALTGAGFLWWYHHPAIERINGVVYGKRGEKPLTLDIIRPRRPNGLGIAFLVSGGWRSQAPGQAPNWIMAPLLRRGYTIFAICHVSQPEASIPEIIEDMHRGIRFVRHHAGEYGIDPDRLGVTGGSAGGHLSLMLATRGKAGPEDAADPVDRESSAVQAVAIFYPPTDLLDLGESTENPGDGGPPRSFVRSFGPGGSDKKEWPRIGRDCSPIYFVHPALPPTLIYHGDVDTLVPLDQSLRYQRRALESGAPVEVIVHRGGAHGWLTMAWDIHHFADWFDQHLRRQEKER